ncbi:WhiB family transcription factor [Mycobacterium phage Mantra]|uniref:WhiB family transcription factor n=1 Tax=Mycobacterium phage Mantra TaxID=2283297 RepID=A0A345MFZ9_9CAUD|nr:WhiB family transcription factor [Mycobacterium phage Mantra]AXH69480.1 WhiB family transcription factor [Mycobacterium phage Mantra]
MTLIDLSFMPAAAVEDKHAWRDLARCAEVDPEVFFPEKGKSAKPAKRICSRCEVRVECLEFALANRENYGVFGGCRSGNGGLCSKRSMVRIRWHEQREQAHPRAGADDPVDDS